MEELRAQEYEKYLLHLENIYHVDRPNPAPIPLQWMSPEDQVATIDRCMEEYGFVPVSTGRYRLSESQIESYSAAKYECASRYPVDVQFTSPLTPDDLDRSYDYLVNVHVPCLEEIGYELPPLGSREAYAQNPAAGAEFADAVEAQTIQLVESGGLASPEEVYERCPRQDSADLRGISD